MTRKPKRTVARVRRSGHDRRHATEGERAASRADRGSGTTDPEVMAAHHPHGAAERAEELDGQMLDFLATQGRALLEEDRAIRHDPAQAIVELAGVLAWAERQDDPVDALVRGIDGEPGFSPVAAWPRLAHVVARHGVGALGPYELECGLLMDQARIELRDRPAIVPRHVYELLDLSDDELAQADRAAAKESGGFRMSLERVATHLAGILLAPARRDAEAKPGNDARG